MLYICVKVCVCINLTAVPEVIDCGSCLAGSKREVVLEVKNSGGEGKFSIRHQDTSHQVCP